MSDSNTVIGTPRLPPSASPQSAAPSPAGSPGSVQTARKLGPSSTSSSFGIGMAPGVGLKGLNTNWQVWGSVSPSSQRNSSISSTTSATDMSPSEGFRSTLGDGWNTPRSSTGTGTWEMSTPGNDLNGSPKEYQQMDSQGSSHSHSLNQHSRSVRVPMPNPQLAAPRIVGLSAEDEQMLSGGLSREDEEKPSGLPTPGSFSPRRYDSQSSDALSMNRYIGGPPTGQSTGYANPPVYPQQSASPNAASINQEKAARTAMDDLTLGVHSMSVEDDYSRTGTMYPPTSVNQQTTLVSQPAVTTIRAAPDVQLPQQHYGGYDLPPRVSKYSEYTGYYARQPTSEYSYSYDTYRSGNPDPAMYGTPLPGGSPTPPSTVYPSLVPQSMPHAAADIHRQPSGVFYDYASSARHANSPYFYAGQPVIFHSPAPAPQSPMQSSAIIGSVPMPMGNKKLGMQLNQQQRMVYPSMRHATPSPHPQMYGAALDYSGQLQMVMPGTAMYGQPIAAQAPVLAVYQQQQQHQPRARRNESNLSLRSPLLDEFRANKARRWELSDIFGHIVEFSGDQHGSRFIQQKLETATAEEKQIFFDEIVPHSALQLIQDVFGNYVIQKLFEHGTQVQKAALGSIMEGHLVSLSLQMYGCRVVQKALECILPEQQRSFVREIDPHVLKLVKDANGNHVVQKILERVDPDALVFVGSFRGNVYDLATHPYGCRVLQRCFEYLPDFQSRALLDELHKYAPNLTQDQFGNYVVQFVIEHGTPEDKRSIIAKLQGQLLSMSRHKFASNVCEKALVMADPDQRHQLIDEIMTPKPDGVSPLVTMMKDQYANYVLQRALTVVEGEQKELLISRIRPQLVTMRRYSSAYSKHLTSIERLLEKTSIGENASE